jgi:hypothetical protein
MSDDPPAAYGTTHVMAFVGKSTAGAGAGSLDDPFDPDGAGGSGVAGSELSQAAMTIINTSTNSKAILLFDFILSS